MTQAVTSYKAYGVYIDEPVTTRCWQAYELILTQAATDLTLDIAAVAGTFWTAAGGSGVGLAAKTTLANIIAKQETRVSWSAPTISDVLIPVAAATSLSAVTQYQITTSSVVPSFLFFTAGAPTAVRFLIVIQLASQQRAERAGSL